MEKVKEVDNFKYLGSVVSSDESSTKEVNARVNEVAKFLGGLKVMFDSNSLSMKVKKKLCEGIAVPMALYVAETWSMGAAGKRMTVGEMRYLRSMRGVMRRDRIRNQEI